MQLKYISIIFSVAGIVFLYFLSTLSQPTIIELNEISKYEGKQVILEGIVTETYTTKYDSQIITIENNNFSTKIFVEGELDIDYGDKIQATGKVQVYKGEWEVVVNNKRFVRILQKWQNITIPLKQLAETPEKYKGLNINVTGYADTIYETYFYLVDPEGKYSIVVTFNPLYYNFTINQKLYVAGRFVFDVNNFRYNLEVGDERNHGIFVVGE
ncbi:MAG: hypothetical protein QHH19_01690 [Candidatus Thermoplasmatota archaeon]|jgi:hypothetical protein|nr:hypothetical protein [Candidatus Thermoplasmatota archaeon]